MSKKFTLNGVEKAPGKWFYRLDTDVCGETSTINIESELRPSDFLKYTKLHQQIDIWLSNKAIPVSLSGTSTPIVSKIATNCSTQRPVNKKASMQPMPTFQRDYQKTIPEVVPTATLVNWNPGDTTDALIVKCREQLMHGSWIGYCAHLLIDTYGIRDHKLKNLIHRVKTKSSSQIDWITIYHKLSTLSDIQREGLDFDTTRYLINKWYTRKQIIIEETEAILATITLPTSLQMVGPQLYTNWVSLVKLINTKYTENGLWSMIRRFMPEESDSTNSRSIHFRDTCNAIDSNIPHPLMYSTWPTALYRLYRIAKLMNITIPTFQ